MFGSRALYCALIVCGWQASAFGKDSRDNAQVAAMEQQALDSMSSPILTDAVAATDALKKWRADFDKIKPTKDQGPEAWADGTPLAQWVDDVDTFLQKRSDEFKQLVQLKDRLANVKANKQAEIGAYRQQLTDIYNSELFAVLDAANVGAQKAQTALTGLVSLKVFEQPVKFDSGVTFQVKGFDPKSFNVSPFSKKTSLTIDIAYTGVKAEASGLYFKPDGTPVLDNIRFMANADAVVGEALRNGLINQIAGLDLPLAKFENAKLLDFREGRGVKGSGLQFDLSLRLSDAVDFLPPLKIKGVLVRSNGTIDLGKDATITCGPITDEPIPVTPSFVFNNHKLTFTPSTKACSIETDLVPSAATAAGDKSPVLFKLNIDLSFPVKEVKVTGTAFVAQQSIGIVEGSISSKAIDFTLTVPAPAGGGKSPIEGLVKGKIVLHLDQDGLAGDGIFTFYEGLTASANMLLKFNGYGSYGVSEGAHLGTLNANISANGGFTPGFKRVTLVGALTVELDLDYMSVAASVVVDVDSDRKPVVIADASALGIAVHLELPSLAKLDLNAIRKELNKETAQLIANLQKAFAHAAEQDSELGVQLDKGLRDSLSNFAKANHIDVIHTGNKTIDNLGGKVSGSLKQGGDEWHNLNQNLDQGAKKLDPSKWHSNYLRPHDQWGNGVLIAIAREDLVRTSLSSVSQTMAPPGALDLSLTKFRLYPDMSNISQGAIRHISSSSPRRRVPPGIAANWGPPDQALPKFGQHLALELPWKAEFQDHVPGLDSVDGQDLKKHGMNRNLSQHVVNRLSAAVQELNHVKVFRSSLTGPSKANLGQIGGKVSELNIQLRYCAAARDGEADGVLAFAIQVAGMSHEINPREPNAKPVTKSSVYNGKVTVKGLFANGMPTAKITIPPLDHGTEFPAEDLLHDAISKAMEKALPQVGEDGRFDERRLSIRNDTGEKLTVWTQIDTHPVGNASAFALEPAEAGNAFRYVLEPNKTYLLMRNDRREAMRGDSARVWAESESGRVWTRNQKESFWLVNEFEGNAGRHYYAPQLETFVYTFQSSNKSINFQTRAVEVHNSTDRPLVVHAKAEYVDLATGAVWADSLPTRIDVGKTIRLKRNDGALFHGDKVKLWAEDEGSKHFRWIKHKTEAVTQATAQGYTAPKIGAFLYTLEPPGTADETASASGLNLRADELWVPDLKGKTIRVAEEELKKIGLNVKLDNNPTLTALVNKQEPISSWHPRGIEVRLSVGRPDTHPEVPPVLVPSVIGKRIMDAEKALEAAKLTAKLENSAEHGTVRTQSPREGTKVRAYTVVALTFKSSGDSANEAVGKIADDKLARKRMQDNITAEAKKIAVAEKDLQEDLAAKLNKKAADDLAAKLNKKAADDLAAKLNKKAADDLAAKLNKKAADDLVAKLNKKAADDLVAKLNKKAADDLAAKLNKKAADDLAAKLNKKAADDLAAKLNKKAADDLAAKLNKKAADDLAAKLNKKAADDLAAKLNKKAADDLAAKLNKKAADDLAAKLNKKAADDLAAKLNKKAADDLAAKLNKKAADDLAAKLNKKTADDLAARLNKKAADDLAAKLNKKAADDLAAKTDLMIANRRTMPNVTNLTLVQAEARLAALGLRMTHTGNPQKGKSINQSSRQGSVLQKGDTVNVVFP